MKKALLICGDTLSKMNVTGDPGVKRGSCPNRKESQPLNSKSSYFFLMKYFPTFPVEKDACNEHSAPLAEMVGTCLKLAGNSMPNFLAANFYMRSDGGGVFEVLDIMNGPVIRGCETLAACQPEAAYGSCKNLTLQTRAPDMESTAGTYSGSVQFSRSLAAVSYSQNTIVFLCFSWLPLLVFTMTQPTIPH
ncbi:unnamed protein product [Eruca vesicaria subsp. sativa]|uniref:Uncharacterized protein n=1 Tax=Eruca vesicaria subsp. sativa TaxID=29727 RepID=A0ABC8L919_ERUVS|nr:unnamed protein product [Eruca vesicaria subsp. sativa]